MKTKKHVKSLKILKEFFFLLSCILGYLPYSHQISPPGGKKLKGANWVPKLGEGQKLKGAHRK